MRLFWIITLTVVCLGTSWSEGSRAKVSGTRAAAKTPAAGKIPVAEALARIKKLQATLADRQKYLSGIYYNARVPMKESFDRHHSPEPTYGYVDAWGDWLYLKWQYTADEFFSPHKSALDLSEKYVGALKFVDRLEIEYLERGMQGWSAAEKRIEQIFADSLEASGEHGASLGQTTVLYKQSWNLPRDDPNYLRMQQESAAWSQRGEAADAVYKQLGEELALLRKRRFFSEIPGRDAGEADGAAAEVHP